MGSLWTAVFYYMNGSCENIYVVLEDTRNTLHNVDVSRACALGQKRSVVARLARNITKIQMECK